MRGKVCDFCKVELGGRGKDDAAYSCTQCGRVWCKVHVPRKRGILYGEPACPSCGVGKKEIIPPPYTR